MTGVTGSGVGVTGGTETTRRTEVLRLLRLLRYEKNKFSDRSMEVLLPALKGNYNRQTDRPINRRTASLGSYTSKRMKIENYIRKL